jgi:hypothetical protein
MNGFSLLSRRQVRDVPKQKGDRGLCVVCRADADCAFSRRPGSPVLACEEFDGLEVAKAKGDNVSQGRNESRGETGEREQSQKPNRSRQGLCRDCRIYDSCVYPKNEGGIWRCEEYQ